MEKQKRQEETLKIIELFRDREVLWNKNCFSYRRNDLKKKALEEIAAECNLTTDAVKKRIKALRSTYVIEKKKVDMSKMSGCEASSVYESSLHWYNEMAFLDSSIVMRKPVDNIQKDSCSSQVFDVFEKVECDEFCLKEEPDELSKQDTSMSYEAPEKLNISDNDNEFTAFATSISYQLQKFPEEDAYKLMAEIQNLLTQRKLKNLRARSLVSLTYPNNDS